MSRRKIWLLAITSIALALYLWQEADKRVLTKIIAARTGPPSVLANTESSAAAPPSASAATASAAAAEAKDVRESRAPWATFDKAFRNNDFKWIVQSARSAPASGSYSYAILALAQCSSLFARGTEADQIAKIEALAQDEPGHREQRVKAVQSLFKACSGLGTREEMIAERRRLSNEIRVANDSYAMELEDALSRLANKDIPRAERQQRLAELLAYEDAATTSVLKATLTADGSSFEGNPLSRLDRIRYGMAWDLVICDVYGACGGRNTWHAQYDCATQGNCDYLDTFSTATDFVPPYMRASVSQYYTHIRDYLRRRDYSAFGLP